MVTLIGESNFIIKDGFIAGLKSSGTDLRNLSLGSSGYFNLINILASQNAITSTSLILIDSLVNDAAFLSTNEEIDTYKATWNNILSQLNRLPVPYIIFGLPRSDKLAISMQLDEFHKEMHQKGASNYLSILDLLGNLARETGNTLSDLYFDSAHPFSSISYLIGASVGRYIKSLNLPTKEIQHQQNDFIRIHLPDYCKAEKVVTRRSSLGTSTFLRLDLNEPIAFRIENEDDLLPLAYSGNYSNPHYHAKFSTDSWQCIKSGHLTGTSSVTPPEKLLTFFRPFHHPNRTISARTPIFIEGTIDSPSEHTEWFNSNLLPTSTPFELGTLLFWKTKSANTRPRPYAHQQDTRLLDVIMDHIQPSIPLIGNFVEASKILKKTSNTIALEPDWED